MKSSLSWLRKLQRRSTKGVLVFVVLKRKKKTTTMAMVAEEGVGVGVGSNNEEDIIIEKVSIDEFEEGEIAGDDSESLKASAAAAIGHEPHPLELSWTLWFDNPSSKSKADWGSSLRKIHTFSTVEEFWSLYNNIRHPSKLAIGADFYCFKHGIEPKWEDPICANGGKWTISFSRGRADTSWLYTLLAMIGEQFDHGDEICGAVVNVRSKWDKVSIWTKNAANQAAQVSIGKQWKTFVDYSESIGFIFHEDAKKPGLAKNTYNA